jgi:hypothetical protein
LLKLFPNDLFVSAYVNVLGNPLTAQDQFGTLRTLWEGGRHGAHIWAGNHRQQGARAGSAGLPARRGQRCPVHGRSPKTLAQWRLRGKGPPAHKVGGRVFYYLDELDAYIAAEGN